MKKRNELALEAVTLMMRPLVKLLIASGVTLPSLIEALKRLFVEIANADFAISGKRQTESRISLLTGVHRKDVKRLREEDVGERPRKAAVSISAQALLRWTGDSRFMDARGKARALKRRTELAGKTAGKLAAKSLSHAISKRKKSEEKNSATFEDLIESVSKDLPARSLLDEWLRQGIVSIDRAGDIVLKREWTTLSKDSSDLLKLISLHGHDRSMAAIENYLSGSTKYAVFSVDGRGVTVEQVQQVRKMIEEKCYPLLDVINREVTLREEASKNSPLASERLSCGIYLYSEPIHTTQKTGTSVL